MIRKAGISFGLKAEATCVQAHWLGLSEVMGILTFASTENSTERIASRTL